MLYERDLHLVHIRLPGPSLTNSSLHFRHLRSATLLGFGRAFGLALGSLYWGVRQLPVQGLHLPVIGTQSTDVTRSVW